MDTIATSTVMRIAAGITVEPEGCWIWQRAKDQAGYGRMWVRDADGAKRITLVHRVSYETFVGPIPEGLEIDHLCRVKSCCNPAHLEPVTHTENVRRIPKMQPPYLCPRGHEKVGDNLYYNEAHGRRQCRKCRIERDRRRSLTHRN